MEPVFWGSSRDFPAESRGAERPWNFQSGPDFLGPVISGRFYVISPGVLCSAVGGPRDFPVEYVISLGSHNDFPVIA